MKISIEGAKELEKQLKNLTKATARNQTRKALKTAAEPLAKAAQANAPRDDGDLQSSITVGTKLNKAQAKLHRKAKEKDAVEVFVGSNERHAHLVEFGTEKMSPQPFMRPAWDSQQDQVLKDIGKELWANVNKSLARGAKKAAKGSKR